MKIEIKTYAKDYLKGLQNKKRKKFNDDIRARALFDWLKEEYYIDGMVEDARAEYKSDSGDIDELKMDIESTSDSYEKERLKKIYDITRYHHNMNKMRLILSDINGVLIEKDGFVYRVSFLLTAYETYYTCLTEGDIIKVFERWVMSHDSIIDYAYDYDYMIDYIQKNEDMFLDVEKIMDYAYRIEGTHLKDEVIENPDIWFNNYDRNDPLTYPSNDDIVRVVKDLLMEDVHEKDGFLRYLIEITANIDIDTQQFFKVDLNTFKDMILNDFTPKQLYYELIDGNNGGSTIETTYDGRDFYIKQLDKYGMFRFIEDAI